jgi:hypothetical protein
MSVRRLTHVVLLLTGIVLGMSISSVAARLRTETQATISGRVVEEAEEEDVRLEFVEAWASCDQGGAVGVRVRNASDVDLSGPARLDLWFTPADGGTSPEDLPLAVELPALAAGQEMPISVLALWGSGVYSFTGQAQPGSPGGDLLSTGDIPFDTELCEEPVDGQIDKDDPPPTDEPGGDQVDEEPAEDGLAEALTGDGSVE